MTAIDAASSLQPVTYPIEVTEIEITPVSSLPSPAPSKPLSLWQRIYKVAKEVITNFLVPALVGALLYWINPTLFAIGFIAGIVFDDHIANSIQKIKNVWKTQPLLSSFITFCAGYLVLPVVFGAASLLSGAHLGSSMSLKAKKNQGSIFSLRTDFE